MLNAKLINKFTFSLCEIYINEYGHSISNLNKFCFSYTICDKHKNLLEIIKNKFPGEKFGDGLSLVFSELVARKLLERHPDSSYSLTKKAYALGTTSPATRILNFFNINPGLNTLIALLSIIIACFSLYVSYTKP